MKIRAKKLLSITPDLPLAFANTVDLNEWHISKEQAKCIVNPYDELYWEVWGEVLETAYRVDQDGIKWVLMEYGSILCEVLED
jgi:hypothetical protein